VTRIVGDADGAKTVQDAYSLGIAIDANDNLFVA
jgi:hypothetical protein